MATATKKNNRNGDSTATLDTSNRVKLDSKVTALYHMVIGGLGETDFSSASFLVVNRFPEKARNMMRRSQMGIKTGAKEAKNPIQCFKDSLYRFPEEVETTIGNTIFGIPAVAIKKAAVRAFKAMDGKFMTDAKGQFFCYGKLDEEETTELVPVVAPAITRLNYKERLLAEVMDVSEDEMLDLLKVEHQYGACLREDDVRVSRGVADIRYRASFPEWRIPFTMGVTPPDVVSRKVLCDAIDSSGRSVGLCENRPEKSGDRWGQFELLTS